MNKETYGVVLETNETTARVKVNRHGDCSNCGACPGDSAMVLDVLNKISAKPGERVIIEMPEVNMLKAAFIVYMLPIIAAVAGFAAGLYIADVTGLNKTFTEIVLTVIFTALSIIYIKKFDKSAGSGNLKQPVIVKICQ